MTMQEVHEFGEYALDVGERRLAKAGRVVPLAPNALDLLVALVRRAAYMKKGDLDRHVAESLAHARAAGAPEGIIADLKEAYAFGGRRGVVEYALRLNVGAPALQLALLFGELGRLDEAFHHLDEAIARHDPSLVHLAVAPQWDCLRGDSRFGDCLERMGLRAAAERLRPPALGEPLPDPG